MNQPILDKKKFARLEKMVRAYNALKCTCVPEEPHYCDWFIARRNVEINARELAPSMIAAINKLLGGLEATSFNEESREEQISELLKEVFDR